MALVRTIFRRNILGRTLVAIGLLALIVGSFVHIFVFRADPILGPWFVWPPVAMVAAGTGIGIANRLKLDREERAEINGGPWTMFAGAVVVLYPFPVVTISTLIDPNEGGAGPIVRLFALGLTIPAGLTVVFFGALLTLRARNARKFTTWD